MEVCHDIVQVAQLRPFSRHGIDGDLLLKSALQYIPGGTGIPFQSQSRTGLADFSFRKSVVFTNIQDIRHMASHLGTPLRFQHVYFRYSVVIIFFRNFMDYTPDKFCMRSFTGEAVSFKEIGKRFIRKHIHRFPGSAFADPAVSIEAVQTEIGVAAVSGIQIRRHLCMHRFAVKIIQYEYLTYRKTHSSRLLLIILYFLV